MLKNTTCYLNFKHESMKQYQYESISYVFYFWLKCVWSVASAFRFLLAILDLIFVRNRPAAENVLSASTDVGIIVFRAWWSLETFSVLSRVISKMFKSLLKFRFLLSLPSSSMRCASWIILFNFSSNDKTNQLLNPTKLNYVQITPNHSYRWNSSKLLAFQSFHV